MTQLPQGCGSLGGKRPLGRPRRRCDDSRMDLKEKELVGVV